MAEFTQFKILSTVDITSGGSDTLIYSVPEDSFVMATLNIVNRNNSSVEFRVASSRSTNSANAEDYVEYDADLLAYGTVERQGLVMQGGENLVMRASNGGVSAVLWGSMTYAPNYVADRGTGGAVVTTFSVAGGNFSMATNAPQSDTLLFQAVGAAMDAYLEGLQGGELMKIYYEEPGFGTFTQTNNFSSYNGTNQVVVTGPAINNINNKITRIDFTAL